MKTKKRAYVSVYNKKGIVEFCRYLHEYGYELVATEGTHRVLSQAGIPVLSAHELTGYPEPLGGKVRAVHPAVYTGIIANQLTKEQLAELPEEDVFPIELVVVNLYPFKEDMEAGVPFEEAAAHIDAGGVALLTAAAKNFLHTVVVCDPEDYERVLCDLAAGAIMEDERKYLMYKAFACAAAYDALVAQYLSGQSNISYPPMLTVTYEKVRDIPQGANPHQKAAMYRVPLSKDGGIAGARQLRGEPLSFSCLLDANAALELIKEFETPAAAICLNGAPAGAGAGESAYEALLAAFGGTSARGAVVAVNGVVDARAASLFAGQGAAAVLAVGFTPEAMAEFAMQPPVSLVELPDIRSRNRQGFDLHKIYGGLLVQSCDGELYREMRTLTSRAPTEEQLRALLLQLRLVRHARRASVALGDGAASRAVVCGARDEDAALQTALLAAGDGAEGASLACGSALLNEERAALCAKAGIRAVVQAGSPAKETLALCDELGIAVVSVDVRHVKV